jgi:hypothetical protein
MTVKSGAEGLTKGLKNAGERLRAAGERVADNNRAINLRLIEQAEENTHEAFKALRAAAQAGTLKDVASIRAQYLRDQGKRQVSHMREIGDLISRFGREAVTPAKAPAATKAPPAAKTPAAAKAAPAAKPRKRATAAKATRAPKAAAKPGG